MSELCVSKPHLVDRLVSDLIFLCSFMLSRPLYFCYFIFLLPYALKIVVFLYPLFVTILLVIAAFCIGVVDDKSSGGLDGGGVGYLVILCNSVVDKWRLGADFDWDEESECWEDVFGMFEMVFGSAEVEESQVEALETQSLECCDGAGDGSEDFLDTEAELEPIPCPNLGNSGSEKEEKRLENFLKILDQFERMASSNVEAKKNVVPLKCTKANKVVENQGAKSPARNGSEATFDKTNVAAKIRAHSQRIASIDHTCEEHGGNALITEKGDEDTQKKSFKVPHSQQLDGYNLGTYGSMRKEKEWKRTLACKLFEERHNVDGGEGMDSLWEAYEMDSNKATTKAKGEKKKSKNKPKRNEVVEEEEEDIDDGQLCCLQALKLSTGKMNLGVGRPNLMKITKAIKGIGWLHNVTKHSKKVHNNGDR